MRKWSRFDGFLMVLNSHLGEKNIFRIKCTNKKDIQEHCLVLQENVINNRLQYKMINYRFIYNN